MKRGAAKSGSASQEGEPLDYAEFFSALRYYAGMSKQEILSSSRAYLTELYARYVKRACENLGVPSDGNDEGKQQNTKGKLSASAYPRDLKAEMDLAKKAAETPPTPIDTDFLSRFSTFDANEYNAD